MDAPAMIDYIRDAIGGLSENERTILHTCFNDDGEIDEDLYSDIADDIPCIDGWGAGMSKFVFWTDKFPDYVFKIPFSGEYNYADSEDFIVSCTVDFLAQVDAKRFTDARDVDRYPTKSAWDYCAVEEYIYKQISNLDIADMFCRTEYLCTTSGLRVYVSERADKVYDRDDKSHTSEGSRKAAEKYKWNILGPYKNAVVIEEYGEDFLNQLANVIDEYDIDDLHDGNFGFMNGWFVCYDYSGFRE